MNNNQEIQKLSPINRKKTQQVCLNPQKKSGQKYNQLWQQSFIDRRCYVCKNYFNAVFDVQFVCFQCAKRVIDSRQLYNCEICKNNKVRLHEILCEECVQNLKWEENTEKLFSNVQKRQCTNCNGQFFSNDVQRQVCGLCDEDFIIWR